MPRPFVLVLLGLVLGIAAVVAAPGDAGAHVAPAAHVASAAAPAAAGTALVAGQEPDAPADDGTGASEDGPVIDEPLPGENIIPEPNSGRPPEEAGDRGGALQAAVFVAILAGVAGIVAMIVRESRRNRARGVGAEH